RRERGRGHILRGTKEIQIAPFAHAVLVGGTARGWGRASVIPDPVRRQGHRRAVVPSQGLVALDRVPENGWPLSPLEFAQAVRYRVLGTHSGSYVWCPCVR